MSCRLVITIDTEPDNQWTMPAPGARPPDLTFANTRGLGRLIDFLRKLGTPATWLTSYSVARDEASVRLLREAAADGDEIGGHLHAWETPPFTGADSLAHPYIYEYEPEVRLAKLGLVTTALAEAFGKGPASYRAGRWGIDAVEYRNIASLGYTIDTSVVPGHDFAASKGLARGGPDFRRHLDGAPPRIHLVGSIREAPVSVTMLGLLGANRLEGLGARLAARLSDRGNLVSRAATRGLAAGGLCRRVWLRPLAHPREELNAAARALARRRAELVNVMFHSSEAYNGTSPRSRDRESVERFYGDLRSIVDTLRLETTIEPCTLSDAVAGR